MKRYNYRRNNGSPSQRKFLGFNFYIQCNGKLSRKNRETLIIRSENYLSSIYHSLPISLGEKINRGISNELDSGLTDLELLDEWNSIYERYGYLIPEFKERWEKRYLKEVQPSNKIRKQDKFEYKLTGLEFRIRQLEILLNKRRFVENMG
jgi:hypothetical protein